MWTIRENANGWDLIDASGAVIHSARRYDQALAFLGDLLALAAGDEPAEPETPASGGLLPESWTDVAGICFSEDTGDGRDFTDCVWSSRDPNVSVMPLMLQTETDMGHFGAVLAGYIETIDVAGTAPKASGRFYDSDAGVQFRDMLLEGRRFGVSVDNGAVDYEWQCVTFDEEAGWCTEEKMLVQSYEIIGLTGTPFPAFAAAAIQLGDAPAPAAAVAASGRFPAKPPREWLTMQEPKLGDPLLVQQNDAGAMAVPLTITDDGHVFGHMAWWGQCHIGYTEECVEPPRSPSNYAKMNLRPTHLDDGGTVLTGPLVVSTDHGMAHLFDPNALDHWANSNLAWADVHVVDGEFGPWFTGAMRPQVTEEQLRVLRSSSVSGEWEDRDGQGLDMLLGLTVSGPGFPIMAQALAASGLNVRPLRTRARVSNGRITRLSAANVVRRECKGCQGASRARGGDGDMAKVLAHLETLERRTRHLVPAAAAFITSGHS